jgi:putative ABC transport system permease protein
MKRGAGARDLWFGPVRLRNALLALEMAAVLVLLAGAGLMIKGFEQLRRVDAGFDVAGKLVVQMTLPRTKYPDTQRVSLFVDRLAEELSGLPGVGAVGAITNPPFASAAGFTSYHLIDGRPLPPPGAEPIGGIELISPSYFAAMAMPLVDGRAFTTRDTATTRPVAIVNTAAARLYWAERSPLGDRIRLARPQAGNARIDTPYEIVGVVRGVKYSADADVRPRVYIPFHQGALPATSVGFVLGPAVPDPARFVSAVRAATERLDPAQPVASARPFADVLHGSIQRQRFQTVLITAFGVVALLLGAIGVYGIVTYHVTQQVREIGIRMAIGAGRSGVVRANSLEHDAAGAGWCDRRAVHRGHPVPSARRRDVPDRWCRSADACRYCHPARHCGRHRGVAPCPPRRRCGSGRGASWGMTCAVQTDGRDAE